MSYLDNDRRDADTGRKPSPLLPDKPYRFTPRLGIFIPAILIFCGLYMACAIGGRALWYGPAWLQLAVEGAIIFASGCVALALIWRKL